MQAVCLDSPDQRERLAALALLEDAIRYFRQPIPQFGGVSGPATESAVLIRAVQSTLGSVSPHLGYKRIRVFYGTNRQPTGSRKPSQWFGHGEGDLELGVCEVTIPRRPIHKIGELESPSWHTVVHRLDPARYIILQSVQPKSDSSFCEILREHVRSSKDKHALVFVHGYRVSFEDAARRTAQLAEDLGIDIPLFYSWPSRARLRGYGADETLVQRAVPTLIRFLNLLSNESGANVVHLIAHSMGALALSRAVVNYLRTCVGGAKQTFREIILAAPDIDAEIFKNEIVPNIVGKGPRITLYASRRDYALLTSSWLRCGLSRAGFIEEGKPLVVRGVETIDVSAVNTEIVWGLLQGHSYVADRPAVVQDMFELLQLGKSAAERFGNEEAHLENLRYWIMGARKA